MSENIGIYVRTSRTGNEIVDFKKHREYLIEICESKGWNYKVYEEIASSTSLEREGLQRLKSDIASGKNDCVMVHSVERLSRETSDFLEIVNGFIEQGMTHLFVTDLSENNVI